MRLSREIIVLDYGDEQTSPYDFDRKTERRTGGNGEKETLTTYAGCFILQPLRDAPICFLS
jgi:hypothetical protein